MGNDLGSAGDRKNDHQSGRDDRIIGIAFRRSLIVLGVIVVGALAVVILNRESAPVEKVRNKTFHLGSSSDHAETPVPPAVHFTDITAAAGFDFVHFNGATGDRLLPETMGSGVAVIDLHEDGDPDLLFVNGQGWPWDGSSPATTPALYVNDGRGRFTEVTGEMGLDVSLYGMGAAVGDYDNDGDDDLFMTAVGRNRLFRNDGRRFTEVTREAGVGGDPQAWSTGAGFFDADNDGDLDLFVVNYVRWSREIDFEVAFTLNGIDRAYGPPFAFAGTHPQLYENLGNGRFQDISAQAGIEIANPATGEPVAKSLGLTFIDLGDDGRLDVFVANDTVQNFLFHNLGNMVFEEVGTATGLAFDGAGRATGAMGVDAGDYRAENRLALAVGNFANEMSSLLVQRDDPWLFADEAAIEGLGAPSRLRLSFGVLFVDYDLDGRLDLAQVNGHLEETIHEVQASQRYQQEAQLFWNAGPEADQVFVEVPADGLGDFATPIVGRSVVSADLDGDGDLDLVLSQNGSSPLVLRNDQETGHHWLRLWLEGVQSNRDAIGACVEVKLGDRTIRRRLMPTRGYLGQVEQVVTIGLGGHGIGELEPVLISWPSGRVQSIVIAEVDRVVRVREGEAIY